MDQTDSRGEGEGPLTFILRRSFEIAREGLLGLLAMAAFAGIMALAFAALAFFSRALPALLGA